MIYRRGQRRDAAFVAGSLRRSDERLASFTAEELTTRRLPMVVLKPQSAVTIAVTDRRCKIPAEGTGVLGASSIFMSLLILGKHGDILAAGRRSKGAAVSSW